ncbi:uncharacterized protein N7511_011501 [Penicillium nucicola]|uniref:uncharacterized protein n=1 Tax=Penicillium nucicola TaxID=1850975 RepID=UPI0025457738|nr:uncharacterized protein N7511_011501 [Penicillium nucicola]KAJ5742482.1 hypothetical protein N7511_011501 [Penicillium nucicola]
MIQEGSELTAPPAAPRSSISFGGFSKPLSSNVSQLIQPYLSHNPRSHLPSLKKEQPATHGNVYGRKPFRADRPIQNHGTGDIRPVEQSSSSFDAYFNRSYKSIRENFKSDGKYQWENYISRGSDAGLAIIQAALIGHTYAMLSGVSSNRLPAQMYISNRNYCHDT